MIQSIIKTKNKIELTIQQCRPQPTTSTQSACLAQFKSWIKTQILPTTKSTPQNTQSSISSQGWFLKSFYLIWLWICFFWGWFWFTDDVVLRQKTPLPHGHAELGSRGGRLARDPGHRHGDFHHGFGPVLPARVPVVLVLWSVVGSQRSHWDGDDEDAQFSKHDHGQ